MKKVVFFLSAAALLAVSSCNKQLDQPESPANGHFAQITAIAPDTKAVFEGDEVMKWQEGDQIGVYASSGSIVPFSLASGAGEAVATFTNPTGDQSETYGDVAIYPYSEGSVFYPAEGTLDLNLPLRYRPNSLADIQRVNMPMVGIPEDGKIFFKHVGGAVKVTINGLSAKNTAWVELLAWGKRVNGVFSGIDLSAEDPVVEVVSAVESEDFNEYNNQRRVVINIPENVELPDPAVLYFPVPAGTYESFSIMAYDRNYSLSFEKQTKVSNTINRGTILRMPAFDAPAEGAIVIDGNPADWVGVDNVVTVECPAESRYTGLVSAKFLYSDKLYILAELSDAATAASPLNMHLYFDTAKFGMYSSSWIDGGIDFMTEGCIMNAGQFVAYGASLYQWSGEKQDDWAWTGLGSVLVYSSAGSGNYYELSVDYSDIPGGMPEEFMIGIDALNGWDTIGYLPQTQHMLVLKKNGIADQPQDSGDDTVYNFKDATSVAMDNSYTPVDGVTTHNLTFTDESGAEIAWFQLVLTTGATTFEGEYTCVEYAHEDHTMGNGYNYPDWGLVGGTRYMDGDNLVIVEPGETLTVTALGGDKYEFAGSSGYKFVGVGAITLPQTEQVEVTLSQFLSLTDYSIYSMTMVGVELGTAGFYYQPADWTTGAPASYPVDGYFLKLEVYSTDGTIAPGTYVASAANGTNSGEFNKGQDYGGGNAGGTVLYTVSGGAVTCTPVTDGTVVIEKSGDVYTITLTSSLVKATYTGKLSADSSEPQGITIDGTFDDWAAVEGVTEGNHTFKVTADETNIYLYSKRSNDDRYSEIWGGAGYLYFGFDLDNNSETGDGGIESWGTGNWETLILTYPYAGSSAAPAIAETAGTSWWILPEPFSISNLQFKGVSGTGGVELEFSIPRSDMAEIPNGQITINAWGNKGLSRAILTATL